MGQKTVRFSDLSGQLIMDDDALARIVVHEHPGLVDGPVEIEALTGEAEAMEQAALRVAVVEVYLPDDVEPRRIVMEADAFDKLATEHPMEQLPPIFAPRASEAGFQAMCAVPMRAHTDTICALNLFRGTDELFSDPELEIARAMAQVATIALIQERAIRERSLLAEQLQTALRSRVVIEQAKGMLAEHLSVTVDQAFQLLNKYARDHNRRLTDVARNVVDRKLRHEALARQPGH
jgi:GAF domain-containing protein